MPDQSERERAEAAAEWLVYNTNTSAVQVKDRWNVFEGIVLMASYSDKELINFARIKGWQS